MALGRVRGCGVWAERLLPVFILKPKPEKIAWLVGRDVAAEYERAHAGAFLDHFFQPEFQKRHAVDLGYQFLSLWGARPTSKNVLAAHFYCLYMP